MQFVSVIALAMVLSISASAEPGHGGGSTTAPKPKPEIKVTHRVNSDSVINEFKVENSMQWVGLMQVYAAKELFSRLEGLPGIANLQFIPGKEVVDEKFYDKKIVATERESSLMVRLEGSSPFTMMFKVKEVLRRCKETALAQSGEGDAVLDQWVYSEWSEAAVGIKAPCRMRSAVEVDGPIAIYGTMPGTMGNRLLLMNQIHFDWEITTDFSNKHTELESRFVVNRVDFPVALRKIVSWTVGNSPFSEVFMDNPQRQALLQVGRIMKLKNHEILRGEK